MCAFAQLLCGFAHVLRYERIVFRWSITSYVGGTLFARYRETNHAMRYIILLCFLLVAEAVGAQGVRRLTLADAVRLARTQSPDALSARHTFRSAYWNYRYYRANYLPSLTLTSDPSLDRSINQVTQSDGTVRFVEQNFINSDLTLNLSQNVPFTGGVVTLSSSLARLDMLTDRTSSWQTAPLQLSYQQSLFGYNSLKWDRRIEPVRYREAQQTYTESLELVAVNAVTYFFNLASAQSDYEIASYNYAHADTLYRMARGRYEQLGTITENEMLQLELNRLTEETNRMNARIEVDNAMQTLRTYLGIQTADTIAVLLTDSVPDFTVSMTQALAEAASNSPDIQNMARRRLEAASNVASARANAGLKADIYLRFGLTQTSDRFSTLYDRLLDQQYVSVGLSLPILDWGRGRGRVRVAKSNRDLVETQVEQDRTDFDLNVRKLVNQFNLQARRLRIAAQADRTAQRRNEVARLLYVRGKSSILDLNASTTEKDASRRAYLSALSEYWSLYYTLRSITLYDFEHGRPLAVDYDELIEE